MTPHRTAAKHTQYAIKQVTYEKTQMAYNNYKVRYINTQTSRQDIESVVSVNY